MQNKKNGFSTIEFVVVLVIMGLIIIITTYGAHSIKKSKLKTTENIEKIQNVQN